MGGISNRGATALAGFKGRDRDAAPRAPDCGFDSLRSQAMDGNASMVAEIPDHTPVRIFSDGLLKSERAGRWLDSMSAMCPRIKYEIPVYQFSAQSQAARSHRAMPEGVAGQVFEPAAYFRNAFMVLSLHSMKRSPQIMLAWMPRGERERRSRFSYATEIIAATGRPRRLGCDC